MEKCARCGHTENEHFIISGCQYEWPIRPFERCSCDGFVHEKSKEVKESKTEEKVS